MLCISLVAYSQEKVLGSYILVAYLSMIAFGWIAWLLPHLGFLLISLNFGYAFLKKHPNVHHYLAGEWYRVRKEIDRKLPKLGKKIDIAQKWIIHLSQSHSFENTWKWLVEYGSRCIYLFRVNEGGDIIYDSLYGPSDDGAQRTRIRSQSSESSD
jgi:hypothetical protein